MVPVRGHSKRDRCFESCCNRRWQQCCSIDGALQTGLPPRLILRRIHHRRARKMSERSNREVCNTRRGRCGAVMFSGVRPDARMMQSRISMHESEEPRCADFAKYETSITRCLKAARQALRVAATASDGAPAGACINEFMFSLSWPRLPIACLSGHRLKGCYLGTREGQHLVALPPGRIPIGRKLYRFLEL